MGELRSMSSTAPVKGSPPLSLSEIDRYLPQVLEWNVIEVDGIRRLERQFVFKNFIEALHFTNEVGKLAEKEDHHPAILTEWGKVRVTLWTHAVDGLHLNDFILAAKVDQIYSD